MYGFLSLIFLSAALFGSQVSAATFQNPVVDHYSPDPFITRENGSYWMILSDNARLTVYKSSRLSNFRDAETRVVYNGQEEGFSQVWAPEIHFIDGCWYIYFAMNIGIGHRTFVLQAEEPWNPLGNWSKPIRMQLDAVNDLWAIDSTVLQYGDGKKYLVWSAWPREDPNYVTNGSIYIAELENPPLKIKGERILIREPTEEWEGLSEAPGVKVFRVNEGPEIIQRGGRTFVVFSAHLAGEPEYCMGIMGIDDLKDPLVPSNWWSKTDGPVFWMSEEEHVYTTGHGAFTVSPDGSESWMIYHAVDDITIDIISHRTTRVQKLEWNLDGTPKFPRPAGVSRQLQVPSGEI